MTTDQFIVTGVILFLLISLYKRVFGPGFTFVIGISVLGLTGILTPSEILKGFANEQIAVIILLLLIGEVIRKSALIDSLFDRFFQKTHTYKGFMLKLIFPVAALSSMINNTPLVAIMMPYVHNWGRRNNIASSKLLIPLSYAAILGGTATLIGTSTNLVVNGLVAEQTVIPGFHTLEIFDFAPVGLSMIVIGGLYLVLFGYKLLPDNSGLKEKLSEKTREYIVEVRISSNSEYHNKTVENAKLRNLKGLFLVEIIRNGQTISPVSPQTRVQENDLLVFAGNTETIADMIENNSNIKPAELGTFGKRNKKEVVEVFVTPNSALLSKTIKESNFRGRYDAAILAVHRNGEKMSGKIGDVTLIAGDLLLLVTGEDFTNRTTDSSDFFVVDKVRSIEKMPTYQSIILIGGLIAAVVLSSLKIVPLFTSLMVFIIVLLLTKIARPKELHQGLNFNLIFIIALSLALGMAMMKTNIAFALSHSFLEFIRPFGVVTLLLGIFVLTNLLASVITNIGAVAIVFPISLSLAEQLGANPKPFVLLVAYAAAASFITPIGYQTNLMVYGPGGYTFRDFMKIGLPLTILFMITTVLLLTLQYDLHLN
ncbi:MAG: SLC13 family permease [Bacteroidales bacterium]|nr:SLC13 family permease [Bacteroidales bacterium]